MQGRLPDEVCGEDDVTEHHSALHLHVCMYVCIYVCMYVCMYTTVHLCALHLYVCMYAHMYVCTPQSPTPAGRREDRPLSVLQPEQKGKLVAFSTFYIFNLKKNIPENSAHFHQLLFP